MCEFCIVCNHPDRAQIESDFHDCKCWRTVARKYGIGVCNVYEHMDIHAARPVEDAPPTPPTLTEAVGFQESLTRLAHAALDLVSASLRRNKSVSETSRALHEALRHLAVIAKLYSPHKQPKSVQEKFINTPEWGRLRTLILEAIWPFEDARKAVSEAMARAQAESDPVGQRP